jgi:hypothetical protein
MMLTPRPSAARRATGALSFLLLLTWLVQPLSAAIRYVNVANPSPKSPYTNWAEAALTIQAAVDAAVSGDEILVTNGVYASGARRGSDGVTNRVSMKSGVALRSVNGPHETTIVGLKAATAASSIRGVYLPASSSIAGFAIIGGSAGTNGQGGCLYSASTLNVISNCLLAFGSATYGGGSHGGRLIDCQVMSNTASFQGGGVFNATVEDSEIAWNRALLAGGGAYGGTIRSSVLIGNKAAASTPMSGLSWGGGAADSRLSRCLVQDNLAGAGGVSQGSDGGGISECVADNCLLLWNISYGPGGAASDSSLINCTVAGNRTLNPQSPANPPYPGGVVYGSSGGVPGYRSLVNTIIYGNAGNSLVVGLVFPVTNCWIGVDPMYANPEGGDFRLQTGSPCINAGGNTFSSPSATDRDGRPRIVGGKVDIGAYEHQGESTNSFIQWLQRLSLPAHISTDAADQDGDILTTWQEWRAGTDPQDPASTLRVQVQNNGLSGRIISWDSVPDRTYFIDRTTDLLTPFTRFQSDIPGQPGTTSHEDTEEIESGAIFYRIGVQ